MVPSYMNITKDENLFNLLNKKTVCFVGPSPHLIGMGLGPYIDSFDIVIRVNEVICDAKDYGCRADVLCHNLNVFYCPILGNFLTANNEFRKKLKYVICAEDIEMDRWSTVNNYNKYVKPFEIPCYILNRYERLDIYREIAPKQYYEGNILNTSNFNNGYGSLLIVLANLVKKVFITSISFYNMGRAEGLKIKNDDGFKPDLAVTASENRKLKYHKKYIDYYNKNGNPEYNNNYTILHDQLAQIKHFKHVVLPYHKNIFIDDYLQHMLYKRELDERIKWHSQLKGD